MLKVNWDFSEYYKLEATSNQSKRLRNKIGVLGVYFRIYKELVPRAKGKKGFLHRFPEPVPDFDNKLGDYCDDSLEVCIENILLHIHSANPWLYPDAGENAEFILNFCPDPCCHDVPTTSSLFSSQECILNNCAERDQCMLKGEFNNDLSAMRNNQWNISCPCETGLTYRSDVGACVNENICDKNDEQCPPNHDCINTIKYPNYKCICQIGFVRGDRPDLCQPVQGWDFQWHGLAHSEPHPKSTSVEHLLPVVVHAVTILLYIDV